METKHTPGPWVIDSDGDGKPFAIITSTHDGDGMDDDICEVYGGNDDNDETRQANSRLIAAAPELLEALQAIAGKSILRLPERFDDLTTVQMPVLVKAIWDARAAIAKATGK